MDMESKHLTPGACEECTEGCGKDFTLLNASRLGHLNCLNACLTAGADVNFLFRYVSLRLRVQNAVSAQPCVGKLGISLVLLNFLDCNFRLWFETP